MSSLIIWLLSFYFLNQMLPVALFPKSQLVYSIIVQYILIFWCSTFFNLAKFLHNKLRSWVLKGRSCRIARTWQTLGMEKKKAKLLWMTLLVLLILQFVLEAIFVEKPIAILYLLVTTTHCAWGRGGGGRGRAKWGQVVGYHAPNAWPCLGKWACQLRVSHRVHIGVEIGGMYLPSQLERTSTTLYVMVDIVKGGERSPLTLTRLG
jgi:hypothetical protein